MDCQFVTGKNSLTPSDPLKHPRSHINTTICQTLEDTLSAEPISARIYPAGILTVLSRMEVERLHDASRGHLGELLRRCALAVLNSGNEGDDAEAMRR